ncbi:MAG: outer spore coat protein CotE [Bacilli bacterium]|nr:outer spore coat protein CotE [Bacilli bacterium]
MALYKEIVTKAIVGKGKKYFKNNYSIEANNKPSTVLGCWVINHLLVDGDN